MRFKELQIGKKFVVVNLPDNIVYTKINEEPHYNTKYGNQIVVSIHKSTKVKEIR